MVSGASNVLAGVALIVGSYLLGSVPLLYLLGRIRGVDLRREEDLHIALWRKVGRLEGILGIVGDLAKGVVPVLLGRALNLELSFIALGGLAAVIGQMWPVLFGFDGEKGNSTGGAMMIVLAPKAMLVALVPMLLGIVIRTAPRLLESGQSLNQWLRFSGPPSRCLPVGMALGFATLPAASWWVGEPPEITLVCLALFLLIMLRRLTAGVGEDLRNSNNVVSILINRLLYDRSYL